jgi:hypothetical protein
MHDLAAVPDEHRNPGDTSSLTHGMVLRSADDGCHRAGSFGRSVENRAISVASRTDRFALSRVNRGEKTHLFSPSRTERLGEVIDSPPCAGPTGTASPVRVAPRLGSGQR